MHCDQSRWYEKLPPGGNTSNTGCISDWRCMSPTGAGAYNWT